MVWLRIFVAVGSICAIQSIAVAWQEPTAEATAPTRRSIMAVVGAAGAEEFGKSFRESAERWRSAFQADDLIILDGSDADKKEEIEHRQQILDWLTRPSLGNTQERWLVLIGHGTNDRTGAKFNLKGPDISAEAISKAIGSVQARWLIIDGSSSSGPFINSLSGANRVIITATKSGAEQNYARFGEFLSRTISDPTTDLDHDDAVSILEAFLAASNRVAQFYQDEGRLASEQALMDDNGDGRGTPAAFYRGARPVKAPANGLKLDGSFASRIIVSSFGAPDKRSPENRALAESLAEKIETLRSQKKELDEDTYYQELERLFLEIAKTNE